MSETFERRYPVTEAQVIVRDRLAEGWTLLGLEGLWVDDDGIRPDLDYVFDGSPDGSRDAEAISAMLATWPRSESFCVEVLFVR